MHVDPNILRSAAQEATFSAAIALIGERCFAASTERRLKELALERMQEMRSSVLLGDLMACDAFDRMDQIEKIGAPALVLCGVEDRMTPPQLSEYLTKHIRGSSLRIIVDAGHMVMLERPDVVAQALDKFLREVPYTPGM
jgi:pimeloyl-ACP methyl ester carboxylesterase